MQEFYDCTALPHTSLMKTELDMHEAGLRNITHALGIGMLIIGGMTLGGTAPSLEAATVSLTWDAPANNPDGSPVANLAGYRLYYGTAPQAYTEKVEVGLAQKATLTNLQEGVAYYFSVVAYNEAGAEGSYSGELSWTALRMSIANAAAGAGGTGMVLKWTSTTNTYYTVLRSTNLMATPAFTALASHIPGAGPVTSYADTDATAGGPYFYKVQVEL